MMTRNKKKKVTSIIPQSPSQCVQTPYDIDRDRLLQENKQLKELLIYLETKYGVKFIEVERLQAQCELLEKMIHAKDKN